ncbi:MAG: OsmC family protein [Actinobacteria bacterium]|nr:OsmC family protein [Actinomycetota bacterium]
MVTVTVSEDAAKPFGQKITDGQHTWNADEPARLGGQDTGPGPYELLASSLGACTSMTLRMYAIKKEWPLDHVEVMIEHEKIDNKDVMRRHIKVSGQLDEEQIQRLLEIANRCPVHRTLSPAISITSEIALDRMTP